MLSNRRIVETKQHEAAGWWNLYGKFSGCTAAYSPKGAVSLADSYANLAYPNNSRVTVGLAPTFDTSTGWTFGGTQFLKTGLTLTNEFSVIVQFTDAVANTRLLGAIDNVGGLRWFSIIPNANDGHYFSYGPDIVKTDVGGAITAGVMGFSGRQGLLNGILNGNILTGVVPSNEIYIGGSNYQENVYQGFKGKIQNIAFYNFNLSPDQYYDITAAIGGTVPDYTGYDIFIIAGQSNASGRGTNSQTFSKTGANESYLFGNDYWYKTMADPTDISTNQIDIVSADTATGSVWPLVATSLSAAGKKTVFIPCARGDTSLVGWQPTDNWKQGLRTYLYDSMAFRTSQVKVHKGTLRAVLFWQGEWDAQHGTTQAEYNADLDTLADAIYSELGCKLMPAKLQNCTGIAQAPQDVINAAIGEAWGNNSNVLTGPDLTSITTDSGDGLHLNGDAVLTAASNLWVAAIKTAFGWS